MKVVMVLYPGNGHKIEFGELEGQPIPGSADEEIGLGEWLESYGHELVTTTDRGTASPRSTSRARTS